MKKALKIQLTLTALVEIPLDVANPDILTAKKSAQMLEDIKAQTLYDFGAKTILEATKEDLKVELVTMPEIPKFNP